MNLEIKGTFEGEGKIQGEWAPGWSFTGTHMPIQVIHSDSALMLLTLLYYRENGNLFRLRCLK